MKKVEEFKETQKLIDEYKALGDKIPELEKKIADNKAQADRRIARLKEEMEMTWEDVEFNISRDELAKETEKQIKVIEEDLKKENSGLEKQIEDTKDSKKFFRTDAHLKTITMEMEEMKKEISKEELDLKKLGIELEEFYADEEKRKADPLKWQEIYRNIDDVKKNIKELKGKLEEYSKFKEELLSINLTPEEYKKMFEMEKEREAVGRTDTTDTGRTDTGKETDSKGTGRTDTTGTDTGKETDSTGTGRTDTTGTDTGKETDSKGTGRTDTTGTDTGKETDSKGTGRTDSKGTGRTDSKGTEQPEEKKKVRIDFDAKTQSYTIRIAKDEGERTSYYYGSVVTKKYSLNELHNSKEFKEFYEKFIEEFGEKSRMDPYVAFLINQSGVPKAVSILGDYYSVMDAGMKKDDLLEKERLILNYDVNGIYRGKYKYSPEMSETIMKYANDSAEYYNASVDKNWYTHYLETHPGVRRMMETVNKIFFAKHQLALPGESGMSGSTSSIRKSKRKTKEPRRTRNLLNIFNRNKGKNTERMNEGEGLSEQEWDEFKEEDEVAQAYEDARNEFVRGLAVKSLQEAGLEGNEEEWIERETAIIMSDFDEKYTYKRGDGNTNGQFQEKQQATDAGREPGDE